VPIVEGRALGTVAVPPEAPAGRVEVEAFGRVELSELGQELPVLQVRLVIVNERGDQPWVVDARHQLIEIAGKGIPRALYASYDHELPILTVPRGEAATLDLYVPPPGTTAPAVEPTQLDVLWQLTTGTRIVAERTRFERLEVDVAPASPTAETAPAVLAFWWVDAEYDWTAFVDPPWIRVRPTKHVVISRGPRQRWILRERRTSR